MGKIKEKWAGAVVSELSEVPELDHLLERSCEWQEDRPAYLIVFEYAENYGQSMVSVRLKPGMEAAATLLGLHVQESVSQSIREYECGPYYASSTDDKVKADSEKVYSVLLEEIW